MPNPNEDDEESGVVLFAGSGSFSMTGRSTKPSSFDGVEENFILGFHRIKLLADVKVTRLITGPIAHHFIAVTASGGAFTWGRNEHGQLGLGDLQNRYEPAPLDLGGGEAVRGGAMSATHTLVYTTSGACFGWGSNASCELGLGLKPGQTVLSPRENTSISGVSCVSAGKGFSVFVDSSGAVYSAGTGEHGVLGHGTDGKTLERAGKFTFALEKVPRRIDALSDHDILAVASGQSHTVAADHDGRLWSWGFNGYGQLGHGDVKTRMEPTAIEFFHNVKKEKPPNVPASGAARPRCASARGRRCAGCRSSTRVWPAACRRRTSWPTRSTSTRGA